MAISPERLSVPNGDAAPELLSRGTIAQETARLLLEIGAVTLRPHQPFRFVSGVLSPIYIDNRFVMSYPPVRTRIINFYLSTIEKEVGRANVDTVSGTAHSAIPVAAWVADRLDVPLVFHRTEAKKHGKENKIEGVLREGARVLIVEDHISTGGTALDNAADIRLHGGVVDFCIATTTYQMKSSQEAFKHAGIRLCTLTDFTVIVEVALQEGYLKPERYELALSWLADPWKWGKP